MLGTKHSRILIVEDEAIVARDIRVQLQELGYDPLPHTGSGEQAIVLAREFRPDLVLMDIELSGAMSGIQAAQAIRKELFIPVVYLTAFADDETVAATRKTEPFGYILKPFSQRDLRTAIEVALFKHKAEARLQASERRFRTIFEAEPECVLVLGECWSLREINTAGLAMFEATSSDEVSSYGFMNFTLPEYRGQVEDLYREATAGNTNSLAFEIAGLRGTRRWLEAHAAPLWDAEACFPLMLCIIRDITARRHAEQALRESEGRLSGIIGSAMDAIITFDDEWNVVQFNPAAERIFRCNIDEVFGRFIHQFIPERFRLAHDEHMRKFAACGHSIRELGGRTEIVALRPCGEEFAAEASILQVDASGKTYFTVILRDISERKRTDRQLLASRERLATLSRHLISAQEAERKRMSRELHDEIGQVFTAVSLHLQLVRSSIPEAFSPMIDDGLQIVGKAIQQVREMSLNMRPLMLDDFGLIPTLRWFIERQRKRSNLEIHLDARIAGLELSTDLKTTCYRIVQESITNIQRHAKAKNAWITYVESEAGIMLTIRDDGCGFDVITCEQRASHGECLGLLGIRERVELLNGQSEIKSESSAGTTINVFLPSHVEATES